MYNYKIFYYSLKKNENFYQLYKKYKNNNNNKQ